MEDETKSGNTDGLSIFLVDDDSDDREIFSEAMVEVDRNIGLSTFSDGNSLLRELLLSDPLPDVIFLDLYMPKMDGAECLAEIRSDKRFDPIGIVIYSSLIDMKRVEELFRKGANRYLRKPSSFPSLVKSLKRTIESVAKNPTGGMTVVNYTE